MPRPSDLASRGVRSAALRMPRTVHNQGRGGFARLLTEIACRTRVSGYPGDGTQRWPALHALDAAALFRLPVEAVPFLGLGAVALLVGGVGVGNIMIISVPERRSEIGLRRALGATRGSIRVQFLSEAILLTLLGGAAGVGVGALATAICATTRGWAIVIPAQAWAGGIGAALAIGAIAGLLPAVRAARMSPTEALRTV